jgi:protein-S-isoprenylcysteine O-methyltransferase Ste14
LYIRRPERIIGLILIIAGTGLRVVCYRSLAKYFTFELSLRKDHRLITNGPYTFIRHPAYAGGLTVHLGSLLFNLGRGGWWAEYAVKSGLGPIWAAVAAMQMTLVALFFRGAILRCRLEDDMMKEHFREQWKIWAERTPYILVPFLF